MNNTRQELVNKLSQNISESENSIFLDALYIHTGNRNFHETEEAKSRLFLQTRGGNRYILLDGKEILEILPLTFDVDEDNVMHTNFKYRIYPK